MPRQKKKKLSLTTSFDEQEESLLLGDDTPTPTRSGRASRRRSGPSLDAQEEELLGESPIVIKKSTKRRRKTRSSADQTPQSSTEDPLADTNSEAVPDSTLALEPVAAPEDLNVSVNKPTSKEDPVTPTVAEITKEISSGEPPATEEVDIYSDLSSNQIIEEVEAEKTEETPTLQPIVSDISIPHTMSDISIDIRDTIPPIQPEADKSVEKAEAPVEEIDIYGDLSANTSPTTANPTAATNGTKGKEISFDEVFKMSEPEAEVKTSAKRVQRYPSEKEEEDLDYEEEAEPQMKIGVLVSKKQLPVETTTPDHGHILPSLPEAAPSVPQPPAPQQQMIPPMLIPPMLPLPPMSGHALRPINFQNTDYRPLQFPPPHYKPISAPSFPRNNSKRKIYINPKFKTQVILSNLEKDGVLKGGVATIHVNSRHISPEEKKSRARSRSPICHSVPEYIPSPIRKALDEPTTTLIVTELSACTTRNRLKEMFASIGTLKEVQTYPQERRAVVTFVHAKDAVVCRRKFHRSFIDGTYMSVNFAI